MNNKLYKVVVALLLVLVLAVTACSTSQTPSTFTVPSLSTEGATNPKTALSTSYEAKTYSIEPSASGYSLPISLQDIYNQQDIVQKILLGDRQRELLTQNGFVVIPWQGDDIIQPYESLKIQEFPIFITTDTLLHLYHIQFNEILKRIEEEEFYDQIVDMSLEMMERADQDYCSFSDEKVKEAARRNVAYFAVALELLQTPTEGYNENALKNEIEQWNRDNPYDTREFNPIKKVQYSVPGYVKNDVASEIQNINEHSGFKPSVIFNSDTGGSCQAPCTYCEDYTQYIPRGHYTRSETLKRYFKAMMWYGRMAFLLKGGEGSECQALEGPLVAEKDADLATIQASLISLELPDVTVGEGTARTIWDRIYSVTSFFVGTADDLTPYEYLEALEEVFGSEFEVGALGNEENLLKLKSELAQLRNPEIYGGSGICVIYPPITKDKLYECLSKTKGMRFMGQRFIPDSFMFQNLVSPAVGLYTGSGTPFTMKMTGIGAARAFPRGLDVMAVLGSERAYTILKEEGDTEYSGKDTSYDLQLEELRNQFGEFTASDWNRNLYWAWLYALMPLIDEFGEEYPAFMQTQAWQDKELQTALSSWAELRHDTILYAKQSYTPQLESAPLEPEPVLGYVEPVPEFYARMLSLTTMTRSGLAQLNALSNDEKTRLESLEIILNRLLDISINELENKELTEADYDFINNFGKELETVVAGVEAEGKETTIVADVHTDLNQPRQVLEEGVGDIDLILVAYKLPDGRIIVGAGPILSHYEFKHPMDDRLTDEKWREMIDSGNTPDRAPWIYNFYAE